MRKTLRVMGLLNFFFARSSSLFPATFCESNKFINRNALKSLSQTLNQDKCLKVIQCI